MSGASEVGDDGDVLVREQNRTDDTNGGDEVEDIMSVSDKSGSKRREADGCDDEDLLAGPLGGGFDAARAGDAGGAGEVGDKEDRRDARGEGGKGNLSRC